MSVPTSTATVFLRRRSVSSAMNSPRRPEVHEGEAQALSDESKRSLWAPRAFVVNLSATFLALMGIAGGVARAGDALKPVELRTEYLRDPVGVEVAAPRFSWQVTSRGRNQKQTAYQVLVASSARALSEERGDLWDSGRVSSSDTLQIAYGGRALASGAAAFWKVRVWDREGEPSSWSPPATWTAGVLRKEDWHAHWISYRDATALPTNREALFLPPARHYRRDFAAPQRIKRAVIHASALGLFELHLNGTRVGDALFEPGWADYHQRGYYRTHDVTPLIRSGANCLGAIVTEGWYSGYVGYGLLVGYGPNRTGRNFYGKTPALLVQLELEYADGSREVVATDPSWTVSGDGPVREADLIMGESYDATRIDDAWAMPADARARVEAVGAGRGARRLTRPANPWRWEPAVAAEANGSTKATFHDPSGPREVELGFQAPPRLQAYAAPPIRVTEELPARSITERSPGIWIVDFGQNFAGVVRLRAKAPAGTRIQLRHGEMLHADGRLMTENLRRARATDFYVFRGDPRGETWAPRFTYHGFQFVEISGLPTRLKREDVTGLVLHNDTPLTSEFACADEVMTRFWRNTQWTQRANFIEMPTDCPQRDERLGWMGDAQVYVRTATYNADVAAFFTKWLDDVVEAQRSFGAYPDYCPYPMAHGLPGQTWGTAWTDAGILCPWTIWQVYGDTRLIERLWPSMVRFMNWRQQRAPDGRGRGDGNTWGDWLNLGEVTPIEFVDAAYFARDAEVMRMMAEALGRRDEAADYASLFARLRARFQEDYLRPGGVLAIDTQTAYALALAFELLPPGTREGAAARLAAKVAANDFRMATGFLGTKSLLPALSSHDRGDLAARLFQSRRFPSWGYEVVNGATTVWERWDSYTKEHGFNGAGGNQNASMNSFSHYSFGAVMEWAFRSLAGIDLVSPGYGRILIAPQPPSPGSNPENPPVDWVKARYDSVRGRIATAWRRQGDRFLIELEIPANTTAELHLPASSPEQIWEGGHPLGQVRGLRWRRLEKGYAVLELGSGKYRFESVVGTSMPKP